LLGECYLNAKLGWESIDADDCVILADNVRLSFKNTVLIFLYADVFMKKVSQSDLFIQRKRYRKWLNSSKRPPRIIVSASVVHKEQHLSFFRKIAVKNLPYPKKALSHKQGNAKKRQLDLKIPNDFSFLTNTVKVLSIISQIAHAHRDKSIAKIHIDHSDMISDDLAAEVLLAHTIAYTESSRRKNGAKFEISGTYPKNREQIRLINSIGVVKELNANNPHEQSDVEKVRIFKRHGLMHEKLNIHVSDQKSRAISGFTDHINQCLGTIKKVLTDDAEQQLGEYIGEIIANAEEHSGTEYWHIYGYLDGTNPKKVYSEIVIYGLGKSISESFEEKRMVDEVDSKIRPYLHRHQGKYSEALLTTVMAMQQFISSKIDDDPTRGQGTIDLLNFFNTISKECISNGDVSPVGRLTIVSGSISIDIDGAYLPKKDERTQKETIYFNGDNSPDLPPDIKYVKEMKGVSFPGTIIAIKFPLKDDSLIREAGEKNE